MQLAGQLARKGINERAPLSKQDAAAHLVLVVSLSKWLAVRLHFGASFAEASGGDSSRASSSTRRAQAEFSIAREQFIIISAAAAGRRSKIRNKTQSEGGARVTCTRLGHLIAGWLQSGAASRLRARQTNWHLQRRRPCLGGTRAVHPAARGRVRAATRKL